MILLDEVLPEYDRRERHSRATDAPAADVWEAIHSLRGEDLRLMRMLMGVRSLGRSRRTDSRTVLEGFGRMGFRVVGERPPSEFVIVGIGRFWLPSGGLREVEGLDEFARFDDPGYAKVAFDFRVGDGEVSTETRIAATDAQARRRFGLYWTLVRPGSGLIRREWLKAIAESARDH